MGLVASHLQRGEQPGGTVAGVIVYRRRGLRSVNCPPPALEPLGQGRPARAPLCSHRVLACARPAAQAQVVLGDASVLCTTGPTLSPSPARII